MKSVGDASRTLAQRRVNLATWKDKKLLEASDSGPSLCERAREECERERESKRAREREGERKRDGGKRDRERAREREREREREMGERETERERESEGERESERRRTTRLSSHKSSKACPNSKVHPKRCP